jgi:hypothetical protein
MSRKRRPAMRLPVIRARIVGLIALAGLVVAGPTIVGVILAVTIIAGPGAALALAIFPRSTIGRVERTLVAGTLGIATLVLGGLLLNVLPGGLTPSTWFSYLLLVTGGALLATLIRPAPAPSRAAGSAQLGQAKSVPGRAAIALGIPMRDLVIIGCAVSIAASALALATVGASFAPRAGFTQLWLIPDPARSAQVQVGVDSMEIAPTEYSVVVTEAGRIIGSWPRIVLQPGERWQQVVALGSPVGARPLEAVLTRADAPGTPYRRVSIAEAPPGPP